MPVVYLVGFPGVGKSTALAGATSDWHLQEQRTQPFAHRVYTEGIVLGRDRPHFPGTDTLSMSVNPKACDFVESHTELIVGEGDRLANRAFFRACHDLTLVYLDASLSVASTRAVHRAALLGIPAQRRAWWQGRVTKVHNLLEQFPHRTIDACQPPEAVAEELRDIIRSARR